MKNNNTSDKKTKKNYYMKWIVIIIVFIGLTLPFHYVPSRMMIFPKDHLTFNHTFITEKYIESVIERTNSAGILERISIYQEPIVRSMLEKGIIIRDDSEGKSEDNANESYRAGLLQKITLKGLIFRTYECEMQISSVINDINVQPPPEKFIFCVKNQELASQLLKLQGKNIIVRCFNEPGTFPWQDDRYVANNVKELR